jgi:hypothetical protein
MITLSVLTVLYTIFGFIKFKKLYGHYMLFEEDMRPWTLLLSSATICTCVIAMLLIIKYLP